MKHAFKKIMALLLAVVMVLGILPASFAANVEPFNDVQESDWFAPYVKYVYEHDPVLMNGINRTTFAPDDTLTRAMAAVVLYRLADPVIPSVRPSTFTDLTEDWYKNGIAWAQQTGVVNGISETKFNPDGLVTREQLVAMMWRYYDKPEVEEDYLSDFTDANKISAYAEMAFNWAISKRIIGGYTDNTLRPQGNATRAEYAKIISVFDEVTKECEGEHLWDEGEIIKAATCTEDGEILYTCIRGDGSKTEVIPALGHSYVDGICSRCGIKLAEAGDIVIYYTNDVHTYIDGALSYDNVADLKAQTAKIADGVLLVDAGDHIQGTAYGSMDKGKTIIELMSAAKYDLATLGNHEFDYGMERALEITEMADFDYVSANFYHESNGVKGNTVLEPFQIFSIGGKKIAIIGITTPESFTKSTPAYFQNEAGEYIYGISGGDNGAALYADVQAAINAANAMGADYIIALGHLGDDPASKPWTSEELIANTVGLDAFIDGHSHSTVEGKLVNDKSGASVLLTQTGEYFNAVGKMTINSDGIKTELITDFNGSNGAVAGIKNQWLSEIETKLGEVIGYAEVTLDNYDAEGSRLVRKQETNTGDFAADALYYLFDVTEGLDVDLAIMNGGGVRNRSVTGELSYLSCKEIHTFGNVACLQTVTGQQILDALEWGARDAGAAECGGFLHVSGVTYEIHTYIPSTVQKDDKGVWTGAPTGEYRVKNVKIGGEDLDVNKTYNMAGYNYTLRDLGDGFAMFEGAVNVKDYVMEDYMVLANYIKSFDRDPEHNNLPTIQSDSIYADVNGEGRITIVSEGQGGNGGGSSANGYVAIYNDANGKVMTTAISSYTSSSSGITKAQLGSAAATLNGEKLSTTANNVALFKMETANGITTFQMADGTYLFCDGTNMGFTATKDENCEFVLEETTGGYFIRLANYLYNGTSAQYIEFYRDVFTCYGMGEASIYTFTFREVEGAGGNGGGNQGGSTSGEDFVLSTEIKAGDEVIIVCAAKNIALSANYPGNSFYNEGIAVAPVNGKISNPDAAIVWTVGEDGEFYTFANNGQKIAMGTEFTSMTLGEVNYKWQVSPAATAGAFYIANLDRDAAKPYYMQWYESKGYWSGYHTITEEFFAMNFYVKGAESGGNDPSDPSDPITPPEGELVFEKVTSSQADWSGKYVIGWDDGSSAVIFNGETDKNENHISSALTDNKVTAPASCIIEIAAVSGGYTLKATGGYLNGKVDSSDKQINAIAFETTPSVATIAWEDGNPIITNAVGTIMRYNNGSGSNGATYSWFRFYKPTSTVKTPVNLYKLSDGSSNPGGDDPSDPIDPPTPPTPGEGDDFVLSTEIKAGDEVIIVCAAKNIALSANYPGNSFYNEGIAVAPVNGKISNPDAAIVWTVGEDGEFYTFANNGQKIAMGTEFTSMTLGEVNYKWQVSPAATAGAFYIANLDRDAAKPYYMQWYESKGYWSGYHTITEEFFAMNFYVKGAETPEDPEQPEDPGEDTCTHRWVRGDVIKAPTCVEEGEMSYKCALCGAEKVEPIAATGVHNYEDGTCVNCGAEEPGEEPDPEGDIFALVTDVADLGEGDVIIITSADATFALSTEQRTNNRGAVAVTPNADGTITSDGTEIQHITLGIGTIEGALTFGVEGGYLYAAGTSNNYLRTQETNDANGEWKITLADGVFTVLAQGDNRPLMRYNISSKLFACYAVGSTTGTTVAIYKQVEDEGGDELPELPDDPCAHTWDEGVETTAPTCTAEGVLTYTCSICEETMTEPIAALEHNEVIDVAVAATCTEAGKTEGKHCDRCGETLTAQEEIAPLGHTEAIDDAVAATCTEAGKTEGSHCSVCNATILAQEEVPALGHNEVIDVAVEATCTEPGLTEGKHCDRCNEVLVAQTVVAANGHSYDEGVETTAPTCTTTGVKTFTCTACGATRTEIIAAIGEHNYVDGACSYCGAKAPVEDCEHEWGEGTEVTAPTCTTAGVKSFTCALCEGTKTEAVEALGHVEVTDAAVDATCTEAGKTEGKHCDRCGEIFVAQEEIAPLGHNEVIDTAVAATCTEAGKTEGKHCDRCGETLTAQEDIAPLGHNEVIDAAVDATCTEAGLTEGSHCSVCGEVSVAQEEVPALGHNEVIDAAVAATCTEIGKTEGKHCDRCNEVLVAQEEIPADGHSYEETVTAPSCTEAGFTTYMCEDCGHSYTDNEVPATGHSFVDGTCENCGESDSEKCVAIYNDANGRVMTTEISTYTNPSDGSTKDQMVSTDALLFGEKVSTTASNVALFKMETVDGITTFQMADGTYLFCDGTNMGFTATKDENCEFVLEEANGGYFIRLANVLVNEKAQYVEYYKEIFTCYSMGSNANIYTFTLREVSCPDGCTATGEGSDPTCTEAGEITFTCSGCGASWSETIPATGHDYNENNVCNECGAEKPVNQDFALSTEIKAGDEIIIVCAAKNIALSSTYGGYYNDGVAVTPVDGIITDPDQAIVWTVGQEGEFYTFSYGGQKLGMGTSYTSMTLGGVNYKWQVTEAATDGAFYIANLDRDPKQAYYMQWRESESYWSGYFTITEELFAMNFYVKGAEPPCAHVWDLGDVTTTPTCTNDGVMTYTCEECGATKTEVIPATGHNFGSGNTCTNCGYEKPDGGAYSIATSLQVGDEIVITVTYNDTNYAMVAEGTSSMAAAEVTVVDSALDIGTAENVVWTVCAGTADGKYTLMSADGKYLYYSGSSTGIKLSDTGSDFELICGNGTAKISYGADSKGTLRSVFFSGASGKTQFRCYADSNMTSANYSSVMTIWKVN